MHREKSLIGLIEFFMGFTSLSFYRHLLLNSRQYIYGIGYEIVDSIIK